MEAIVLLWRCKFQRTYSIGSRVKGFGRRYLNLPYFSQVFSCFFGHFCAFSTLNTWHVPYSGEFSGKFFARCVLKKSCGYLKINYAGNSFQDHRRLPEQLLAVMWIRDILVRIRIRGYVPLTNGSWFGSCYFLPWPSKRQQNTFFPAYDFLKIQYIYILFLR